MTKLILLIPKRPDLSDAEFHRYWSEHHRPLVAGLPGLRRLVFNHGLADGMGGTLAYEGVSEAWWDSLEAMQASFASPEARAVLADTPNFIDLERLRQLVVEEEPVPLPEGAAKA